MAVIKSGGGADHLVRRAAVAQGKLELPQLQNILLVEDRHFDARRLTGVLHIVLGRDIDVRIAHSLDKTIDAVLQSPPDLIFLDDYLEPSDSALDTIPLVRRAGYAGPIVVVSGELERERTIALKKAGASGCIHKDDVNSVEISAILIKVFVTKA